MVKVLIVGTTEYSEFNSLVNSALEELQTFQSAKILDVKYHPTDTYTEAMIIYECGN